MDQYSCEFGFDQILARGLDGYAGSIANLCTDTNASQTIDDETKFLAAMTAASLFNSRVSCSLGWSPEALGDIEITLRSLVRHASPTIHHDRARQGVMQRLSSLARTGISFCMGLDIEPYGSFVSGLYTPTGDLDLSIEGTAIMFDPKTGVEKHISVAELDRKSREKFLVALAGRLNAGRSVEKLLRLTHARVPIIKFIDKQTRVECDVAIDSIGAQFKSTAIGLVAGIDWRVSAMVRLIKLWSRAHNLNDSASGTFNSFALTLLVIFHLQTRTPAVLPPLCELVLGEGVDPSNLDSRPLQSGKRPDIRILAEMQRRADQWAENSLKNRETLAELLTSFFSMFQGVFTGWCGADEALSRVLRRVRIDTWNGSFRLAPWEDKKDGTYFCSIEDPFDATDNCGRTIRDAPCIDRIRTALDEAVQLCSTLTTVEQADAAMEQLFGRDAVVQAIREDQAALGRSGRAHSLAAPVAPTPMFIPPSLRREFLYKRLDRGAAEHRNRPEINGGGGVGMDAPQIPGFAVVQASLLGVEPFKLIPAMDAGGNGAEEEVKEIIEELRAGRWAQLQTKVAELSALFAAEETEKEAAAAARREAKKAKQRVKREAKEAEKAKKKAERAKERQQQSGENQANANMPNRSDNGGTVLVKRATNNEYIPIAAGASAVVAANGDGRSNSAMEVDEVPEIRSDLLSLRLEGGRSGGAEEDIGPAAVVLPRAANNDDALRNDNRKKEHRTDKDRPRKDKNRHRQQQQQGSGGGGETSEHQRLLPMPPPLPPPGHDPPAGNVLPLLPVYDDSAARNDGGVKKKKFRYGRGRRYKKDGGGGNAEAAGPPQQP